MKDSFYWLLAGLCLFIPSLTAELLQKDKDGNFKRSYAVSESCDACVWAALHAKSVYDSDSCVDSSSMDAWQQVLRKGCSGEKECAQLIASKGASMAGALLDAVADGDDAEERSMSNEEFQNLLCHEYANVCRENHLYAHVRTVTFISEAGPDMDDVAIYRRGSVQAGMLPQMPIIVLTPGKSDTQIARQGFAFREEYAWRLLPMVPVACPGRSISDDPARCVVECRKKRDRPRRADAASYGELGAPGAASCTPAERLCKKIKECQTISLSADQSKGFLKQLGTPWDSPSVTDIFLDDSLHQRYIIRGNPDFDDTMPSMVPDNTARKPEAWDDAEDGSWEAPLVPNTANLRNNPRFLVSKEAVVV
jgi:hypothetical protein